MYDARIEIMLINVLIRRFREIAKSDYELHHVCPSVRPSTWNNSAPTGQILMKFDI